MIAPESLDSLDDRVAIVTGSTAGIGLAVAQLLASRGAGVVINGRTSAGDGMTIAKRLPDAVYVAADVGEEAGCDLLVEQAIQRWGRIDILVNNAGTTKRIAHSDLQGADLSVWQEIFATNLFGAWNMVRSAERHLKAAQGHVINVSSVAGLRPVGSSIPYSVSKAGLNQLTVLLAAALGPDVRVNAVAPGVIDTRWNAGLDEVKEKTSARVPLRRIGTPEDVARACLSLLASSFVTGTIVSVDGGEHLL